MSPGYQAGVLTSVGPSGQAVGVTAPTTDQPPAPGAPDAPVLEVSDLAVDIPTDGGTVHAVRGITFALRPGRVLGIVGESGSGKTMMALAVMGLLPPRARARGSVRVGGREVLGRKERDLRSVRGRQVAMVFQDPMTSLNPVYRVGWQLAEAVRAHQRVSRAQAWERAVELLQQVGIPDAVAQARSYPHQYSGGMRQRAVIAMAMANDPGVIIADEPTSSLDVTVQAQVLDTIRQVQRRSSAALVLISHDLGVVAGMADDVVVMYAGRAVEAGPVDAVFGEPGMPYTQGLLASLPRLDAAVGALTPIPGAPPSPTEVPCGCPFAPRCSQVEERCTTNEPALLAVAPTGHAVACHCTSTTTTTATPAGRGPEAAGDG